MFLKTIFFCTFLLVCLSVATQATISCYQCNSRNKPQCAIGKFKAKGIDKIDCPENSRGAGVSIPAECSVIKYIENGEEVTERGCFLENANFPGTGKRDECMEWRKTPATTRHVECHACKTTLCNAAPTLRATIGTMIALISLGAVFF